MAVLLSCASIAPADAQPQHDHTAQHGGILVPAAGDTMHVEVTWPLQRVVRVFVYDSVMRPIPPDRLLGLRGRIRVGDQAYELRPSSAGLLEGRIPSLAVPVRMTLEMSLTPGGEQEPFSLVFSGYSVDKETTDFVLPPTPIPGTLAGLLSALRDDKRDAHGTVNAGGLTVAYAPAVRARDHLLALETYLPTLVPSARPRADAAALAALRAAWLLHVAADNALTPFEVRAAADLLADALDDVVDAFGGVSR
jgi:hypothetical protein